MVSASSKNMCFWWGIIGKVEAKSIPITPRNEREIRF